MLAIGILFWIKGLYTMNAQMLTKVMSSKSARQRYPVLDKWFIHDECLNDDENYVDQIRSPKLSCFG